MNTIQNNKKHGARHNQQDHVTLQSIHDLTTELGAICSLSHTNQDNLKKNVILMIDNKAHQVETVVSQTTNEGGLVVYITLSEQADQDKVNCPLCDCLLNVPTYGYWQCMSCASVFQFQAEVGTILPSRLPLMAAPAEIA